MGYRRSNGSHPVSQLRDEMDRLVHNFFGPGQLRAVAPVRSFPALNVWEDGENIYVEAELPGLKSDDLEITVVGDDLTIRGHRGGQPGEGLTCHRQERGVGEFNRVLRLPVEVDGDKVEARLSDGILLVKLPQAEAAKPKKIKVTPGQ